MNRFLIIALITLLSSSFSWAQTSQPRKPKRPRELVLGTYAYDSNPRISNLSHFSNYLSQKLNVDVRTVSYKTVPDLLNAVQAGKVDIAFPNTFGYVHLMAQAAPVVTPLAVMELPETGQNQYSGCILVSKSSGITSASQLKQQASHLRLTFTSPSSTSGHLVQGYFFNAIGLLEPERQFKSVAYSGTHTAAAKAVATGTTEVAALGTNEYYRLLSTKEINANDVTVLWVSPEIPFGPVVCGNHLSGKFQLKLQNIFLKLHQKDPAAYKAIQNGWVEAASAPQYKPVQPEKYEPFMRLLSHQALTQDSKVN